MSETSALASLRIAEDRIEWSARCRLSSWGPYELAEKAQSVAAALDAQAPSCGPHRVVSPRVIVTECSDADE